MFLSFNKKYNSNDITECCIVGYEYGLVGFISVYKDEVFSDVENILFDVQVA